jgi:hypothetical protein
MYLELFGIHLLSPIRPVDTNDPGGHGSVVAIAQIQCELGPPARICLVLKMHPERSWIKAWPCYDEIKW